MQGLRKLREAKGYTQQEVSQASGVARNTISEIESGSRDARRSTERKLASALGVQTTYFALEWLLLLPAPTVEQHLEVLDLGMLEALDREMTAEFHRLMEWSKGEGDTEEERRERGNEIGKRHIFLQIQIRNKREEMLNELGKEANG